MQPKTQKNKKNRRTLKIPTYSIAALPKRYKLEAKNLLNTFVKKFRRILQNSWPQQNRKKIVFPPKAPYNSNETLFENHSGEVYENHFDDVNLNQSGSFFKQ
jgi:hypothetical protein